MSERSTSRRAGRPFRAAGALALLLAVGGVRAADKAPAEPRALAGKSMAPAGTLLARTGDGPWQVVAPRSDVSTGDTLLALPLSRASVMAKNGGVELQFWGNLPQLSDFPILESAVTLHEPKGADLEMTFERGRVVVSNVKREGAARARVRLPRDAWELTLNEPGTEVALEKFGRWPRGVPFLTDPDSGEEPTQVMVLLVLQGTAELRTGGRQFALSAPPGAASFYWDSVAGNDAGPQRRLELPEWRVRDALKTPEGKAALEVLQDVAQSYRGGQKPEEVVAALMSGADKETNALRAGAMRRGAVYGMAALDLLDGLTDALGHKDADVRETAVQALRHWIGRGPGQDLRLYGYLQKRKKFSPAHAEIVLSLLHSYADADLRKPETFEALIAYLRHPQPSVRQLAGWHLYRLTPAGKDIAYDPAGASEGWEQAFKAWKKLIPTGELPRR